MCRSITLVLLCLLPTLALAMPNPAAENCKKQGLKYTLHNNVGYCVFPDGSRCEEWAYFRHECKTGAATPIGAAAPNGAEAVAPTAPAAPNDAAATAPNEQDDTLINEDTEDEVDNPSDNSSSNQGPDESTVAPAP